MSLLRRSPEKKSWRLFRDMTHVRSHEEMSDTASFKHSILPMDGWYGGMLW